MPFQFRFLDSVLETHYQNEKRTTKIFALFTSLSILVASIGLFGLSAYTTSLRTKEIGIRKVFGAGVKDVLVLLSKGFTKMILLSFLLATPISWYIMETWWLQNFAFRIQISAWTMIIADLGALFLTWLMVSFQSIKTAMVNPVNSLKSE